VQVHGIVYQMGANRFGLTFVDTRSFGELWLVGLLASIGGFL